MLFGGNIICADHKDSKRRTLLIKKYDCSWLSDHSEENERNVDLKNHRIKRQSDAPGQRQHFVETRFRY